MGLADLERDLAAPAPASGGGLAALEADLSAPPVEPKSRGQQLYDAFAQPATRVVGRALELASTPFVPLARLGQGESLKAALGPESFTTQGAGGVAQQAREQSAAQIVPQTPLQAGIMAGTLAAGPVSRAVPLLAPLTQYPALTRILGGTLGGAAGGYTEDPTLAGAGRGAAWGAGTTAAGEALGKATEWGARILPGGKGAANEEAARRLADIAQTVEPETGPAIQAAKQGLSPRLTGPRTPAALQESVLGGSLQDAASRGMNRAITTITQQNPNLRVTGPATQDAWAAMPDLAKRYLVGPDTGIPGAAGPGGLTLPQAQAVRAWIGSQAFSQSPVGQGVGKIPQQKLWQDVTNEIEQALGPRLLPLWQKANQSYGGVMALQDALSGANAFSGGPNQIALNTPNVQRYLSLNRQDLERRMGKPAFDALVSAATGGGQLGTQDILTPGFGHAMDALRQVYGRGQGGAPQIIGSLLRTGTPNIGSQYTGAGPLRLPPAVQQLVDLILQRKLAGIENPPLQEQKAP